ncbi:hypothetical protein HII31_08086 [Pseudocercospora fuligena]|uniref:Vacuolar segregation subunit 7 n=1 Tax=Pseudocercospora fuligena TaxID=685502 RepID=A0A8H6RHZ6_9PEZI|nr:hypothetical protein HII31_08086 [Pseudocercospora fuligena]
MANKDSGGEFRSISGQAETAEPPSAGGSANGSSGASTPTPATARKSSTQQTKTTSLNSAERIPTLRKSSSSNLTPIAASPAAQSPRSSRNASPIRQDKPQQLSAGLSTQPSAAAIQRALSASSVPQLSQKGPTVSEAVSKLPGRQAPKTSTGTGDNTPQWPISPRLKSPPPSGPSSRRGSAVASKKPEAPSIQVLSATPQSGSATPAAQPAADARRSEVQLQAPPPPKASSRGPSGKSMLETVQENSTDAQEPSPAALQAAADLKPLTKVTEDDAKTSPVKGDMKAELEKHTQPGESGSESAGNKSDSSKPRGRRESQGAVNTQAKRSQTTSVPGKGNYPIGSAKARQEAGKQNMTVETETVASIPQSGLAPARDSSNLRASDSGAIRLKPSNETIRPKKERKKADRKTRSVTQGTATSKADIFEARVANAVEDANTSDSDETFVYESNPPEPQRRQRHHSRTPSVTSSHSVADQQRIRPYGDPFDERRVGGKRSMKFSTNPYNALDPDTPDSNNGTIRSTTPRHFGRHGRGAHHSATYDQQDSPFTQATKLRNSHLNHGRSRPTSPRSPQNMQFQPRSFLSGSKKQEPYDFDAEQNADDERTPLVGTVRTPRRYMHHHRFAGSISQNSMDDYDDNRGRWCCSGRLGACLLTTLVVILVIVSAICFVFASNRPLYDVRIHKIQNVLASEQELMLDLLVGAVNPNTLGISVSDMDVNVFAKSKHVGNGHKNQTETDESITPRRCSRRGLRSLGDKGGDPNNPSQDPDGHWKPPGGDKDSDSDLEKDAQTMLLGRIFHFDQALTFEASPIKQHEHVSTGQLRLTKPGNKTESGGSARWEEVIQYPFELIVRGVLKYQLPISSRVQSAAVGAKVMVHPEEGIDQGGNMRVEPIDHSEHWQWIDWPDVDSENDDAVDSKSRIEELE